MSVIHFNPKELGLIASVISERMIPRETVLSYLETLSLENSQEYLERYTQETSCNSWTSKEIARYVKLSLTKQEKIDAYESWLSLLYNTNSDKNKTIKSIIGKQLLASCIQSLKNSWAIE